MIQTLLTGALIVCAWYGMAQKSRSRFISVVIVLVATSGAYFVWLPEHATAVAHYLGVGRGADLILYLWVVISVAVLLNLHLKLTSQMQLITELARHLAIQEAIHGSSAIVRPKGSAIGR